MRTRALRHVLSDTQGTALLEFAIAAPVLLLLFLGGYQLSDASACKRKATTLSRAIADMVSQYTIISESELHDVLTASTQIMSPYDIDDAQVRVSLITVDNTKKGKVVWSCGLNVPARVKNTYLTTLPTSLSNTDDVYILSEVTYNYDRKLGNIIPAIQFSQNLYMLPRRSGTIILKPSEGTSPCPTT